MHSPIFFLKDVNFAFHTKVILKDIELFIYKKDKICLIGDNGSGKSTLLKIIANLYVLDEGKRYSSPSLRTYYLKQNHNIDSKNYPLHWLKEENVESENYELTEILDTLQVPENTLIQNLSGGQKKRLLLANTLIKKPDLLLLDEPTNHLDISIIHWLEKYFINYDGAIICVSHDKKFLSNVTNKLWWINSGILRKSDKGYQYFQSWQEEVLTQERKALEKMNQKFEKEIKWLHQGVTARRKRNQGRLKNLQILRENINNTKTTKINLDIIPSDMIKKSKFIIEAENISFGYEGKNIFTDINIKIIKGERIGIIGTNGSGKSTLVEVLLKNKIPSSGAVRHGKNLEIAYFSQDKKELNEKDTVLTTLSPGGNEYVLFQGKSMHIIAYLKKFMFDKKILNSSISFLSGGQLNRLLLAKILLGENSNLLVLDEPTNDLDMTTCDILLDFLCEYRGSVIVISHDRDFLDNLVTRTLILVNDKIIDIKGGYNEYNQYLIKNKKKEIHSKKNQLIKKKYKNTQNKILNDKISYKDKYFLQSAPAIIKSLEQEIRTLNKELSNENLFSDDKEKFDTLTKLLDQKERKMNEIMSRWISLDEKFNIKK